MKAALAAGIASGYVLGRRRKAKLAFAVATYVVGRRFRLHPRDLASEGLRRLKDNEHVSQLTEQIRGELAHAGKTAASAATNHHLSGLADTLKSRTEAIVGCAANASGDGARDTERTERGDKASGARGEGDDCPPGDGDADQDETRQEESSQEAAEETAEPRKRASNGKRAAGKKAGRTPAGGERS